MGFDRLGDVYSGPGKNRGWPWPPTRIPWRLPGNWPERDPTGRATRRDVWLALDKLGAAYVEIGTDGGCAAVLRRGLDDHPAVRRTSDRATWNPSATCHSAMNESATSGWSWAEPRKRWPLMNRPWNWGSGMRRGGCGERRGPARIVRRIRQAGQRVFAAGTASRGPGCLSGVSADRAVHVGQGAREHAVAARRLGSHRSPRRCPIGAGPARGGLGFVPEAREMAERLAERDPGKCVRPVRFVGGTRQSRRCTGRRRSRSGRTGELRSRP